MGSYPRWMDVFHRIFFGFISPACLFILCVTLLPLCISQAISTHPLASSSLSRQHFESITNIFYNIFSSERNKFRLFTARNENPPGDSGTWCTSKPHDKFREKWLMPHFFFFFFFYQWTSLRGKGRKCMTNRRFKKETFSKFPHDSQPIEFTTVYFSSHVQIKSRPATCPCIKVKLQ